MIIDQTGLVINLKLSCNKRKENFSFGMAHFKFIFIHASSDNYGLFEAKKAIKENIISSQRKVDVLPVSNAKRKNVSIHEPFIFHHDIYFLNFFILRSCIESELFFLLIRNTRFLNMEFTFKYRIRELLRHEYITLVLASVVT